MKIESVVKPVKSLRGRILGYCANFESLGTTRNHATKESAVSNLARLIQFRCTAESANVQVLPLRGHVGIFSYDLNGYVGLRHLWPRESRVSLSTGYPSLHDAQESFRMSVSQLTWDGDAEDSNILADSQRAEFRSWVHFQKSYKHAHEVLGMTDVEAHSFACNPANYAAIAAIAA